MCYDVCARFGMNLCGEKALFELAAVELPCPKRDCFYFCLRHAIQSVHCTMQMTISPKSPIFHLTLVTDINNLFACEKGNLEPSSGTGESSNFTRSPQNLMWPCRALRMRCPYREMLIAAETQYPLVTRSGYRWCSHDASVDG